MTDGRDSSTTALERLVAERIGLPPGYRTAAPGNAADGLSSVLEDTLDEDLRALLEELQQRFGSTVKAVLLYGSYTRGARDSLIDLYVLLDAYPAVVPRWQVLANRLLPPNVYQLEAATGVRCKYALLPMRQFVRCLERDFHSYFWARFAQPCQLIFVSDAVSAATLVDGLAAGVRRFLSEVAATPQWQQRGLSEDSGWDTRAFADGLKLTYECELRAESGVRADELVARNQQYFDALAASFRTGQTEHPPSGLAALRWTMRKLWGKCLSVLRLIKAAFTFNDGFEYLLWKIERHSGIYVEPTAAQKKAPLLLGWPLFYRLYRLGAFR